jgi:hypothetical protein
VKGCTAVGDGRFSVSTLNKLDCTPGQGLDQGGRCNRAWAKAGSKEHDPRPMHAWNHEDRASDSVRYPSFSQHVPHLPHAFIVTGEFAHSWRPPMGYVNVIEPVKQLALDYFGGFWHVSDVQEFAAPRKSLLQLLQRQRLPRILFSDLDFEPVMQTDQSNPRVVERDLETVRQVGNAANVNRLYRYAVHHQRTRQFVIHEGLWQHNLLLSCPSNSACLPR